MKRMILVFLCLCSTGSPYPRVDLEPEGEKESWFCFCFGSTGSMYPRVNLEPKRRILGFLYFGSIGSMYFRLNLEPEIRILVCLLFCSIVSMYPRVNLEPEREEGSWFLYVLVQQVLRILEQTWNLREEKDPGLYVLV